MHGLKVFQFNCAVAATFLWRLFLVYSPVGLFVGFRFRWPLSVMSDDLLPTIMYPALAGALCALIATVIYFILKPQKILFPLLIFLADVGMIFSPVSDVLIAKGFADYIRPSSRYINDHCKPLNFSQDNKIFQFGICNLTHRQDGIQDFDFVYDSSGDIARYKELDSKDKKIFAETVRKYDNDDPASGFEYADFTAQQFYPNFYYVSFDESETEGFTATFGRPPKNPNNHYPPMF
jgi:hypothetical protein